MKARFLAATGAAAMGLAVFATLVRLPAGLFARQPAALVVAVLGDVRFWAALIVTLPLAAGLAFAATGYLIGRGGDASRARAAVEPLLWGASAPIASLALDPWFFHRTAHIVASAGLALGVLVSWSRLEKAGWTPTWSANRGLVVIVAGACLIATMLVLPGAPRLLPISGDEPHYLVIARSLWVDGDIDIANEYDQNLTTPFWQGELSSHAKPGLDPTSRYSIHGTGLALWLAPWFGAGQNLPRPAFVVLVRLAMTLWLAAATATLFLLLRRIAGRRAAFRGTAVASLTLPLVFAGPHLFPAVPVFTLSCIAFLMIRDEPDPRRALAAGLALGCLPWLHFKFFGLMAVLAFLGAWNIRTTVKPERRVAAWLALLTPLVVSGLAHLGFTWSLYGRLSPLAIPVGADPTLRASALGDNWNAYLSDPVGALSTGIGYFFDQREGLLFYAPHYLLAVAGFAWLARRRRFDAISLILVVLAVAGPYALSQEIGRWGPPARPLTGALWALAVPMAVGLAIPCGDSTSGARRSIFRALIVTWGIGTTVLLLSQPDLLYHDYNVPRSLVLLSYGAPGAAISGLAPVWLGPDAVMWWGSALWLLAAAVAAVFLWRWGIDASRYEDLDREGVRASAAASAPVVLRVAAIAILIATAALLVHHALVPVSELHIPWSFEPITYWKPQNPPTRAWMSENGIWTGGQDSVHLVVSSPTPLEWLVLRLDSLTPMTAEIQLGRDRQRQRVAPGERSLARLTPGPGTRWNGAYFYHLHVTAPESMSRAELGLDGDTRFLGVFLELLEAKTGEIAE